MPPSTAAQPMPPSYAPAQQARPLPQAHFSAHPSQAYPFPPGSVESAAMSPHVRRKRPRLYARELLCATPKRLMMALRSGQELEVIWAMNTLTVLLYDDLAPPFSLSSEVNLLNLCLDHLMALLAVLFPDSFQVEADQHDEQAVDFPEDDDEQSRKPSLVELAKSVRSTDDDKLTKVKASVAKSGKNEDFTRITRTGRKVFVEKDSKKPLLLDRLCKAEQADKDVVDRKQPGEFFHYSFVLCHCSWCSKLFNLPGKDIDIVCLHAQMQARRPFPCPDFVDASTTAL